MLHGKTFKDDFLCNDLCAESCQSGVTGLSQRILALAKGCEFLTRINEA